MRQKTDPTFSLGLFEAKPDSDYVRTKEAQDFVNEQFKILSSQSGCFYSLVGEENYIFSFANRYFEKINVDVEWSFLNTKYQLDRHQKAKERQRVEPYHILDIGAGNFKLTDTLHKKFANGIKAYGISASEFRTNNKLIDEFHVINNAENLDDVFTSQSFDLIVSRASFMHFVDSIGSLKKAYKKLKPGGFLLVDLLHIYGCENYLKEIVAWIQDQGYPIAVSGVEDAAISPICLQKPIDGTLPELSFPVLFAGFSEEVAPHVVYKPHPDLLKRKKSHTHYTEDAQFLFQQAIEINGSLFDKCQNLPSLFCDPDYEKLESSQKFIFVLAINAKTLTVDEHDKLIVKLTELGKNNQVIEKVLRLIKRDAGQVITHFENACYPYSFPEKLSPEYLLNCIQIAAIKEMYMLKQYNQTLNQLNKMGIPYNAIYNDSHPRSYGTLKFPQKIVNWYQEAQCNQTPVLPTPAFS